MKPNCEVIKDLLPLYADNMVSKATMETVQDHLSDCDSCRKELERVKAAVTFMVPPHKVTEKQLKRMAYRKIYMPIIAVLLLLLTVLNGVLICGTIPVWLTYEEAIVSVETVRGGVRLNLTEKAAEYVFRDTRTDQGSAIGIVYYGYRLDMGRNARVRDSVLFLDSAVGDAFWYRGDMVGTEDVLMHGDLQYSLQAETRIPNATIATSHCLEYLCMATAGAGLLCLVIGLLLRKQGKHIRFIRLAIGFLCCAASCLFVTDGHLLYLESAILPMGFVKPLLAVTTMTGLSFGTVLSMIKACKVLRRNK